MKSKHFPCQFVEVCEKKSSLDVKIAENAALEAYSEEMEISRVERVSRIKANVTQIKLNFRLNLVSSGLILAQSAIRKLHISYI